MNPLYKKILYGAVALVIVLILAGAWYARYTASKALVAFLRQDLAAYLTPPVLDGGKTYTVFQGQARAAGAPSVSLNTEVQVLGAARYSVLARIDPILSFAGTDPDKLSAATQALQQGINNFAGDYPADERPEITALYPLHFLTAVSTLERLRQALVATSSPQQVKAYHAQVDATLSAFQNDLGAYMAALRAANQQSTCLTFSAGHTCISPLLVQLQNLSAMAADRQTEEDARWACYGGKVSACTPLANSFAATAKILQAPAKATETTPETPFFAGIAQMGVLERSFLPPEAIAAQPADVPKAVAIIQSRCFAGFTPYYSLEWFPTPAGMALKPNLENNIFLFDLQNAPANPYLETIREKSGLSYLIQNEANTYECPDIGFDLSRALTIYGMRHELASAPILARFASSTDPLLRAAAAQEETLRTAEVPSDGNLTSYEKALAAVLHDSPGDAALAARIGTSTVFALERASLAIRSNSMRYDELVNDVAFTDLSVHRLLQLGGSLPPFFLLVGHGAPSILYAPFNHTLATASSTDFLTDFTITPYKKFHIVTYNQGGSTLTALSKEDILNIAQRTRTLYGGSEVLYGDFPAQ